MFADDMNIYKSNDFIKLWCDLENNFDFFRDNKLILKDNKISCMKFSIIC